MSCKKENPPPECEVPVPPPEYGFPAVEGAYWVYQWFSVYPDGTEEEYSQPQTISVTGDTLIDGQEYTVLEYYFLSTTTPTVKLIGDNGSQLVHPDGGVYLDYSVTEIPYDVQSADFGVTPELFRYTIDHDPHEVVTEAGTFTAASHAIYFHRENNEDLNDCGDTVIVEEIAYADGIGEVLNRTAYYGQFTSQCVYLERRLQSYFIPE